MADDPREALGRAVHQERVALEAEIAAREGRHRFNLGDWEDRTADQRELDMRIGAAAVREQDGARLAEVRQAAVTFRNVRAGVLHPEAEALYHAVLQVIDKVPLGGQEQERSDEKDVRPSVTVDLNVRVRKHETYSGFEDVTGADPSSLRWGDRILAVEVESSICAEAVVTAVDAEKRFVYLVPDWYGWRDLEPASPVAAELDGQLPLPGTEP